ncbi:MAG: lysylphosphatidylglycerol synthase transmembrane domain-containing protein [Bacteroidota bacterium]
MPPTLVFAAKAALAAGVLALVVQFADPAAAVDALRHARPWPLAVALLLVPVNVGLETFRWWRLVRRLSPEVSYGDALVAVLGGYPLGLLTPGRVGEYVGRSALLRGVPGGQAAALTFAEKMATLAVVLVGGLVALAHFLSAQVAASPLWPAVAVFSALWTGALWLALLYPSGARSVLGALLPFAPVRRALTAFDAVSMRDAAELLALSAIRYGVFVAQFVLLAWAFAPEAALGALLASVALVYFAKSAVHSITLGDLGVREGAAVYFFGAYGVGSGAALDAALGAFALNLLLPALVGVPLLLRMRRRPVPAAT